MKALKLSLPASCAALVALLVGLGGSAPAQGGGALPPQNCGQHFKDPKGDHNTNAQDNDAADVNLDVLEGWFSFDASKGDKALTANLRVADMSERVNSDATGVVWNFAWDDDGGTTRFVRVLIDFSGGPYYEFGSVNTDTPLSRFQYEGPTEGTLIPGPNGGLSIVVPKAHAPTGKKLTQIFGSGNASKQAVPGALPTPTRGLSTIIDSAPDGAVAHSGAKGGYTVGPCDSGAAPATGPAESPAPNTAPAPAPSGPQAGNGPLPVTLASKTIKAAKKGKTTTVKLKSSETVTKLVAQLRSKKGVVAKGKLAKLTKSGTLKLKASKAFKKGAYVLDIAGFDAKGARRVTSLQLKVK